MSAWGGRQKAPPRSAAAVHVCSVAGQLATYIVTESELLASLRSLRRPGATTEPFRDDFSYSLNAQKLAQMGRAVAA